MSRTLTQQLLCSAYGPEVKTVVTLSLGDSLFPAAAVRGAYVVAIIFTFPLVLFPASQEIEGAFLLRSSGSSRSSFSKKQGRVNGDLLRLVLLACCWLLAFAGRSSLDHIVALLGSLCSAPLALVVPPLMHRGVRVRRAQHEKKSKSPPASWWKRCCYCVMDIILAVTGLAIMVFSTAMVVKTWNEEKAVVATAATAATEDLMGTVVDADS